MSNKAEQRTALDYIIQTATFAAHNIRATNKGKDTAAGMAEESARRLLALAGYISGQFPELYPIDKLPVIFRAERSGDFKGDVTAVFPTLSWDGSGLDLTTYDHVGQHGAGSMGWYHGTRAATPAEYAPLLAELRGYYMRSSGPDDPPIELVVYRRMTAQHKAECLALARKARASLMESK